MAKKKDRKKDETSPVDEFDNDLVDAEPEPVEAQPEPEPERTPVVPEKAPESPPKPEAPKPLVSLEVFCKVAGPKWDQMAGFKRYAKVNGLGPLSIPGWRAEFQKFQERPTK